MRNWLVNTKGSARPGGVEAKRPPRGRRDGRCLAFQPGGSFSVQEVPE